MNPVCPLFELPDTDVSNVGLARDARSRHAHEARALATEAVDESARLHGAQRAFFRADEQLLLGGHPHGVQGQAGPHEQLQVGFGSAFSRFDSSIDNGSFRVRPYRRCGRRFLTVPGHDFVVRGSRARQITRCSSSSPSCLR
jgi:hypothetical protein